MNIRREGELETLPAEVREIVARIAEIVGGLNADRIDLERSVLVRDDKGVHLRLHPADDKATGVHICVREKSDIAVGIIHGGHEHFDTGNTEGPVAESALARFRALLYATQATTVKLKGGKTVSSEILFLEGDHVIGEITSRDFPAVLLGSASQERTLFSFL